MKKPSGHLQLNYSEPGVWRFTGELSMYGVSELWSMLKKHRPQQGKWNIDCQQVSMVDSAGIALLLDCMRHAAQHHLALSIQALPQEVKPLIQAQGVTEFFQDTQFRNA